MSVNCIFSCPTMSANAFFFRVTKTWDCEVKTSLRYSHLNKSIVILCFCFKSQIKECCEKTVLLNVKGEPRSGGVVAKPTAAASAPAKSGPSIVKPGGPPPVSSPVDFSVQDKELNYIVKITLRFCFILLIGCVGCIWI